MNGDLKSVFSSLLIPTMIGFAAYPFGKEAIAADDIVVDQKTPESATETVREVQIINVNGEVMRGQVRLIQFDPRQNQNAPQKRELHQQVLNEFVQQPALAGRQANLNDKIAFDQRLFGAFGGERVFQKKVDAELARAIDEVNRVCNLTADQRHKLELAGKVDRKRLDHRIEEVRAKWNQPDNDQLSTDLRELRVKFGSCLFGYDSFFMKSIRLTLTDQQLAKHRLAHHSESIKLAMASIEPQVTLTSAQRDEFVRLAEDIVLTDPNFEPNSHPLTNWSRALILTQMGMVAEKRLKPLVDQSQWETLGPLMEKYSRSKTIR